jgi:predicted AlkP superfamily phosphohydrolase/phosphomutase
MKDGAPAFETFEPFYALGERRRVAVLDVPMTRLSGQVDGVQVLGWGGHFPHTRSESSPPGLYAELVARHGENPIRDKDAGIWWDNEYLAWLDRAVADSVAARSRVCADLMAREDWDLFVPVFSETHSAGHEVYCFHRPDHPLHAALGTDPDAEDVLRRTYEQIDRAIGDIVARAPDGAAVMAFSLHGMGPNYSDLLSSVMLPEMLFRMAFPGRAAIAPGTPGTDPGPIRVHARRRSWSTELWTRYVDANALVRLVRSATPSRFLRAGVNGLQSPYSESAREQALFWHPAMWYRPLWPSMPAFALPGFTKGRIRINLRGRERDGTVDPVDYAALCDRIEAHLHRLRDARTGEPVVRSVFRTRIDPLDRDPTLPDFDLDVLWHTRVTDVVDSPDVGRIGPVPHFRAGGHWNRGFVAVAGQGIAPGTRLRDGEAVDLAPTILGLLGESVPAHFDGRSLLDTAASSPAVLIEDEVAGA